MKLDIKVRRFDPQRDYPVVYRVYSDMYEQYKLFDIVSLNSPEYFPKVFERTLSYGYQDFFVVETSSEEFVGFIISYDFKPNDRHAKTLLYVEEKYRSLYGAAIGLLFIDYLFTYYNIRKVYTEVYEYNIPSVNMHTSLGFVEEARLKGYRYYRNKYWDYIFYSIERTTFYEKSDKLIKQLEISNRFL